MGTQITYDKMFDIMNVNNIVIFEDTFLAKNTKNEICYGLVRMSVENRNSMLKELESIDATGKEQLESFVIEFDKMFEAIHNWDDEIPYNDIETAFQIIEEDNEYRDLIPAVRDKYNIISIEDWKQKDKMLAVLYSYGVGAECANFYEDLFNEYIQKEARWKCFRIFRDFSAATEADFKKYMEYALKDGGMIVCILDDQLKNRKCAKEISKCIAKMQLSFNERLKVIGVIYSSFPNQDYINDNIYFEYIGKNASRQKLQAALTKSSYSCILSELKGVYENVLAEAFDEAVKNKNIAYYLSSMADYEGVTNYQIITNWIKLLFEYKLSDEKELTSIARMSRLINLLEDEKVQFSKEMLDLNTFEAFDFSVNKYREPIASGDIFIIKKDIYILIGQDCDMMNSSSRVRKNGISELVQASTVSQCYIDNPVKLDRQYIFVSNFRKNKGDAVKTLRIRYSSREFIENQILQLCQFNDEGQCILDINEMHYNMTGIEPIYYEEMYSDLVSYFNAILKISKSENKALEIIVGNQQSKRILTLLDYDEQDAQKGVVKYKIHRICRLKHPYMLYLYKMYLEHQGRHPFDSINMSRVQEIQVKMMQDETKLVTVYVVLTPNRDKNINQIESMDWYIDAVVLENIVSQMLNRAVEISGIEQYIEITTTETLFECFLTTGEKKKMKIMKINDSISIEECN